MLIEFRVENHRSIRDEQVLSMEAGELRDSEDSRPRELEGHPKRLLTVAAIYGANGSGKSNVLAALSFMRDAVVDSQRSWEPLGGVPRDPFAWGEERTKPSFFEVVVRLGSTKVQYGFVLNDESVLEEWLFAWPNKRKQLWFEREGDTFTFGAHLAGENQTVKQVTRPNGLFLSTAAQLGHEQLTPLYEWFRQLERRNVVGPRTRHSDARDERLLARTLELGASTQQLSLFGREPQLRLATEQFRDLLRAADAGILDVAVEEHQGRPRVMVRHQVDAGEAWLPLEEESQGTLTLFRIGLPLLATLRSGGLLLIDELEASLHPNLALRIVQLFNTPQTNPNNAQLIFATHDTHLLGTLTDLPPLRRDQIWLTEKDKTGATVLYPLTDYRPRKSENLERGYLQGRYGAVPYLGELARVAT